MRCGYAAQAGDAVLALCLPFPDKPVYTFIPISPHARLPVPLQEGHDNKGAWRLRQHANLALSQLCEFFRGRLAASMEHCIGERDLDLPNHVDKAQKLLAQNTAVVNITLNPI